MVDLVRCGVYDHSRLFGRADGLSAWNLAAGRRVYFVDRHCPGDVSGGVVAHLQTITTGWRQAEERKSRGERVNMVPTIIISVILAAIVGLIIYRLVRDAKAGRGGCAGCDYADNCGAAKVLPKKSERGCREQHKDR